jgi:hypothetical protein
MALTEDEFAQMRRLVKDRVENYPDLAGMVAVGRLIKRGAWYQPTEKAAHDAIIQYATAIRVSKDGKGQIKVSKPSKSLKAIAAKL